MNFVALLCSLLIHISLRGPVVSVSAHSSNYYIRNQIRQIGVQELGGFVRKNLGALLYFNMFSSISYGNALGAKEQSLGKEWLYLGLLHHSRNSRVDNINHMPFLDNCLTSLLLLKSLPFLHPHQDYLPLPSFLAFVDFTLTTREIAAG